MKVENVYVMPDNTASVKCPNCGEIKIISLGAIKDRKEILKVICSCEKTINVSLEFRKMFRKETELQGFYVNSSQENDDGKILVKNISMSGIGFITHGKHKIERDHQLKIDFFLDNREKTKVSREAMVKMIQRNYIGCEFIKLEFDKFLVFYLMP